jgi:hypothetical protein
MIGQQVKIGREGKSENEGEEDHSETFEHFPSPTGVQASKITVLIDARGAVCAARHSTFTPSGAGPAW